MAKEVVECRADRSHEVRLEPGSNSVSRLDCAAEIGVQLSRTTGGQVLLGVPVTDLSELRPGDLLFTDSNRAGTIVAYGRVAAGGGMQIAAPRTGDVVKLQPVPFDRIRAARRLLDA